MDDKTRQFSIRSIVIIGTLTIAIALLFSVVAYVSAVFDGRASIPTELKSAVVVALVLIVGAIGPAVSTWIQTRTSSRQTEIIKTAVAQNTTATEKAVTDATHEIRSGFRNGDGEVMVDKVYTKLMQGDRRHTPPPESEHL